MKKTSWQIWLRCQRELISALPYAAAIMPPPQGSGRPSVVLGSGPASVSVREAMTYSAPDGDFTVLIDNRSMRALPEFVTPADWDVKCQWAPDEEEWGALSSGS